MKHILTLAAFVLATSCFGQVPDYLPTDGLVAWYPFNGDANDESPFGNDASVVGASLTEDRFGLPLRAYSFDGNDHIESPHQDWLNHGEGSFTWCGWGLNLGTPGWGHLLTKGLFTSAPYSGKGTALRIYNTIHVAHYAGEDGSGYESDGNGITCDVENPSNNWFHVVGVTDKELGLISIYLNGDLVCSEELDNSSYDGDHNGGLFIGCEHPYVPLPSGPQYFVGKLDDLGIWNRALTAPEVAALYNAPGPSQGCVDEEACNYDPEAILDDGSCHFNCLFCNEGTVWNELTQGCDVANPSDTDFDGCVGMTDLLDLLSVFGTCNEIPWSCGDLLEYQGCDYETVQIGEQCWFAENLRAENYRNGDEIPVGLSDEEWSSTTSGAMAVYGEGSSLCNSHAPDGDACDSGWSLAEYGRLYNWYAVNDSRGLCPSGWYVPESSALEALVNASGGFSSGGFGLKYVSGWNNDGNGSNASGFQGLPGGFKNWDGKFLKAGEDGNWWSSSEAEEGAWHLFIRDFTNEAFLSGTIPATGLSIRCLQDSE